MKQTIIIVLLAALFSACDKEIERSQEISQSFSFPSMVLYDTITLPDGRRAIQKDTCYTVTVIIDEPQKPRPILITGSSTTVNWDLKPFNDAGYPVVKYNRGGGYTLADMLGKTSKQPFAWDSLISLNPKQWILQGFDNDVAAKRRLVDIQNDFKTIANKITAAIPDCEIIFLHAKPTEPNKKVIYPTGENGWTITEYFNRNITNWGTATFPGRFFVVDTYNPYILWNPKRLNATRYKTDLVHWNTEGYKVANSLLMPKLKK